LEQVGSVCVCVTVVFTAPEGPKEGSKTFIF
jgi:hypothetical protein